MVCDDERDQSVNSAAFSLLHHITRVRLAAGRLAVIDATNLETWARRRLLRIANGNHVRAVAIAFNIPLEKCLERNLARSERVVNENVVGLHAALFQRAIARLRLEGYAHIYYIDEANLNDVMVERVSY